MEENKEFNDPLVDIDPVMEDTYLESGEALDNAFEKENSEYYTDTTNSVSDVQFQNIAPAEGGKPIESDVFGNIPINLSVELGRSKISLKEVFELTEGAIIELERLVGEPLDLVVNGQVIAQGEVVAIDNNYGLRITNVVASVK